MNTDFKTHPYSKVRSNFKAIIVQQNDNELTVPSLSTRLVTQFIEVEFEA